MTKILVERWQKLAGILTEEKEDMTGKKCEKCGKGKYKETSVQDDMHGVLHCPKCGHEVKRWREESLSERTSPEAAQDIAAYFGTNDSVDGPYKKVSDTQPFDDDEHKKEFLKKIHAEGIIREGKYPASATEYAEQLNDKSTGSFKLVTDPEHWDQVGVHTGEDLAKYLAIEAHQNAYKEAYGIRPRHVDYDKLSIEEIEQLADDAWKAAEENDDGYRDYEEEEYQTQQDELHKDEDERDEWDKEYDKWEDLEIEWDK